MKRYTQAVLLELDRTEMREIAGGDGTDFFHDLGYVVGYVVGCVANAVQFASQNPPPSYAYGKVGYSS